MKLTNTIRDKIVKKTKLTTFAETKAALAVRTQVFLDLFVDTVLSQHKQAFNTLPADWVATATDFSFVDQTAHRAVRAMKATKPIPVPFYLRTKPYGSVVVSEVPPQLLGMFEQLGGDMDALAADENHPDDVARAVIQTIIDNTGSPYTVDELTRILGEA